MGSVHDSAGSNGRKSDFSDQIGPGREYSSLCAWSLELYPHPLSSAGIQLPINYQLASRG